MLNESLNKKYLEMNAVEIISFHPFVFIRVLINTFKKAGIEITSEDASKIVDLTMNDDNSLKFLHREISINLKDYNVLFHMMGSKFSFKIKSLIYYSEWEFNISKKTLSEFMKTMKNKIEFFIEANEDEEKAYYKILKNYEEDTDIRKSKYCTLEELDDLFENISKTYSGYIFRHSVVKKFKKIEISIKIKFDFFAFLNIIDSPKYLKNENLFKYTFQQQELRKIVLYIVKFCERKFDYRFHKIIFSSNEIMLYGSDDLNELNLKKETIDTAIEIIDVEDQTRQTFYRKIVKEMFSSS